MSEITSLFHHIHHNNGKHEVHHCGGQHKKTDPKLDYAIVHCACGKHSINQLIAVGHTVSATFELAELTVRFTEKCPHGGWHIESGILD